MPAGSPIDYQTIHYDGNKPYWRRANGERVFLPPLVAMQSRDPRAVAWARSMGVYQDDAGQVVNQSAPGSSYLRERGHWNAETGQWDQDVNWNNIMATAVGGTIAAPYVAGALSTGAAGGAAPSVNGVSTALPGTVATQGASASVLGGGGGGGGMGFWSAAGKWLGGRTAETVIGAGLDIYGNVMAGRADQRAGEAEERMFNRALDEEIKERDYNRTFDEDERRYSREWNEGERGYRRGFDERAVADYEPWRVQQPQLAARLSEMAGRAPVPVSAEDIYGRGDVAAMRPPTRVSQMVRR